MNENIEDKIEKQTNIALIKDNKNKKRKQIIISLIIIILLAVIGIFYYVTNNPRIIMKTAVNKIFNSFDNNYNYEEGTSTFKLTDKNSNDFIDISLDYNQDNENGLYDANAKILFTGQTDLDIHFQQTKNKLYFKIPLLNNNYYIYEQKALTKNETDKIIKTIQNSFNDVINNEKINGEDISIKINNKGIKTKRVSLTINNDNIKDITTIFANNLENCEEFVKLMNDNLKANETIDFSKLITDKIDNPITINLYVTGLSNDFIKFEVYTENNDNITHSFSIIKIKDNNYEYNYINNNDSINGNIIIEGNKITSDFKSITNGNTEEGRIEINNKVKEAKDYKPKNINKKEVQELTEEELNNLYMGLFVLIFYSTSTNN